ncbi:MAG TPA: hypothetical protein PLE76_08260 [Rectinema sp.]|jgi:hypothetical protein|nr:hypothetical protein [Rectinema sp.]
MKKAFLFIIVFLVAIVSMMTAQSFGIKMGSTLEELAAMGCNPTLMEGESYIYYVTPPQPHSLFKTYSVIVSPTYGVYRIFAFTGEISCSQYVTELKDKFSDIKKQLALTYGKSKDYDYLKYSSIWKEPQDWMMSLYKKDRILTSFWAKESGSNVPNDLDGIMLEANALSNTKGVLVLRYDSINAGKAVDEIKAVQGSVF